MLRIEAGQCGLCEHFGEDHATDERIVQIRVNGEAPEDLMEDCGHPTHAGLHLKVAPNSGCDGFTPAKVA